MKKKWEKLHISSKSLGVFNSIIDISNFGIGKKKRRKRKKKKKERKMWRKKREENEKNAKRSNAEFPLVIDDKSQKGIHDLWVQNWSNFEKKCNLKCNVLENIISFGYHCETKLQTHKIYCWLIIHDNLK